MFGVKNFSAIINPPQVGFSLYVIGVHVQVNYARDILKLPYYSLTVCTVAMCRTSTVCHCYTSMRALFVACRLASWLWEEQKSDWCPTQTTKRGELLYSLQFSFDSWIISSYPLAIDMQNTLNFNANLRCAGEIKISLFIGLTSLKLVDQCRRVFVCLQLPGGDGHERDVELWSPGGRWRCRRSVAAAFQTLPGETNCNAFIEWIND